MDAILQSQALEERNSGLGLQTPPRGIEAPLEGHGYARASRKMVLGMLCLAFALSACSQATSDSPLTGQHFGEYDISQIVSAYQNDIAEFQALTKTTLGSEILRDGWVTDKELAEVRSRFKECLAGEGVEHIVFYTDGSYEILENGEDGANSSPLAHDGVDSLDPESMCMEETDEEIVEAAFVLMRTNPLNEDFESLMMDCLQKHGVIEKGTSSGDLEPVLGGTASENDDALGECVRDPLGLLPEGQEAMVP